MSDKQQSAVDFLFERLERMIPKTALYNQDKRIYFDQAKELFKQQIIDARIPKNLFCQIDHQEAINEAEQYFNETFKTESNGK